MLNCSKSIQSQYGSCNDLLPKLKNIRKIDEGSTAYVYRARMDDRSVAIKIMSEKEAMTSELDIACKASSLGVGPRIIGWIYCREYPPLSTVPGRYLYLFMEYLPYKFEEALIQGEPLCILFQILYQLNILWKNGISHRDIHPQNIFVREDFLEKEYQIGGNTYNIACQHTVLIGDYGRSVQNTDDHDIDIAQMREFVNNMFDTIEGINTLEYYLIRNDLEGALQSSLFELFHQE